MVSFRVLRWKETYTIAATPFRETLLVNNLNYPPPAQSPLTKENHGRSSGLRRVVVSAGYRVGKGSNLFPSACGIVWAFPPPAWFLMPSIRRRPRCAPQKRLSHSTAVYNFNKLFDRYYTLPQISYILMNKL